MISSKTNLNSDWPDKIEGKEGGMASQREATIGKICMKMYGSLEKTKALRYG